ncbi:MAG TPA: hypothetical protein DEB06_06355 [Phycisphaerales bacterium]|nr:hypothetical protein [Phycisphaerales bacterium]
MKKNGFAVAVALGALGGSASAAVVLSNSGAPGDNFTHVGANNVGQAIGASKWYYNNVRNSGVVGVNTNLPRSGNGSLWFDVNVGPGGNSSKADAEFYNTAVAMNGNYLATSILGGLSQLTALSFDWYRSSGSAPEDQASDWLHPVVRLQVVNQAQTQFGYLVFEREANRDVFGPHPTPVSSPRDSWQTDDVFGGNYRLWSTGSSLPFNLNGTNGPAKYYDALTLADWQTQFGDLLVTGVSVGVGSGWGAFHGAVDNVSFGFAGAPITTYNFEVVPAPGALALMGLAGLAGARRRR